MSFISTVLDPPSYGWISQDGFLIKPSNRQIFIEFFRRLNVFKSRKNWLSFFCWSCIVCLLPVFITFIVLQVQNFSLWLLAAAFLYGMVVMGTHGTIWYHRYCTHNAYTFTNKFWRFVTSHLVIKLIPEEIYVVSHHVHHAMSDKPGDPYNAEGGFLYCFLADVNHQPIAKNLSPADYKKVTEMLAHTGSNVHSYRHYLKWGSACSPLKTVFGVLLNWAFWFFIFFLIGGAYLAVAVFAGAFVWGLGVRTFNYEGHAKGGKRHVNGNDFNRNDKSINQLWPGIVAGEWHNNHHLYPRSARSGFLPYQIDLAWCYIKTLKFIGAVKSYRDDKQNFIKKYKIPYQVQLKEAQTQKQSDVNYN